VAWFEIDKRPVTPRRRYSRYVARRTFEPLLDREAGGFRWQHVRVWLLCDMQFRRSGGGHSIRPFPKLLHPVGRRTCMITLLQGPTDRSAQSRSTNSSAEMPAPIAKPEKRRGRSTRANGRGRWNGGHGRWTREEGSLRTIERPPSGPGRPSTATFVDTPERAGWALTARRNKVDRLGFMIDGPTTFREGRCCRAKCCCPRTATPSVEQIDRPFHRGFDDHQVVGR